MAVSAQTSAKLSAAAKSAPRDAHGHFIKAGTDPTKTVATEIKTESPLLTVSNPPPLPTIPPKLPAPRDTRGTRDTSASSGSLDEPLVVINNPFHKLLHWLDDIRKKQTTTFDLKISVPLIALPIFLIVLGGAFQYVFTLGKQSEKAQITTMPTPTSTTQKSILISKVGYIRGTYQIESHISPITLISRISPHQTVLSDETTSTPPPIPPSNTPIPPTNTPVPPTVTPTPTFTPSPTPIPPSRFVLVDKDDKIFFLITPSTLSLNRYLNQRVLLTGIYDAKKETITIKKYADIEVLP